MMRAFARVAGPARMRAMSWTAAGCSERMSGRLAEPGSGLRTWSALATGTFMIGVLRQQRQPVAAVLQLGRDHVNDVLVALDASVDDDQARAHHDLAESLQRLGPDHRVGDAGLVLDGHEHHALGRAGALAHQHDAGDRHVGAVLGLRSSWQARTRRALNRSRRKLMGWALSESLQRLVVVDDVLRQRHRRQRDRGLDSRLARLAPGEQRQRHGRRPAPSPPTAPGGDRARASGRRRPPRAAPGSSFTPPGHRSCTSRKDRAATIFFAASSCIPSIWRNQTRAGRAHGCPLPRWRALALR